mgnify:CR=1 FL=1
MSTKSLLHLFLVFAAFLGMVSSEGSAMEFDELDKSESGISFLAPSTIQTKILYVQPQDFINRDVRILKTILQKHNGDPYAYDADYGELGDPIVEFAKKHEHFGQPETLSRVIELYEKDKSKGLLNSPRITWLAVQLSMALTKEDNSKKKVISFASKVIEHLKKTHNHTPLWLLDIDTLETYEKNTQSYFFMMLKACHSFFNPIAVYQGSGSFTLKDYFKAMSSGVFLFSLDPLQGKGHTIHGGIFKSGAEKTLHDMIHYYQQWLENYKDLIQDDNLIKKYERYAGIWKKMAEKVSDVLETNKTLSDQEKAQLEIFSFLMMHGGTYSIPSALQHFKKGSLIDIMRIIADALRNNLIPSLSKPDDKVKFYEAYCKKDAEEENPGHEFHSITEIKEEDDTEDFKTWITYIAKRKEKNSTQAKRIEIWVHGLGNYQHWKTFYRDLGHMLINKKLWTPKNTKLGTEYEMGKVKNVIEQMCKWFMKVTDPNGELYKPFSEVMFSE